MQSQLYNSKTMFNITKCPDIESLCNTIIDDLMTINNVIFLYILCYTKNGHLIPIAQASKNSLTGEVNKEIAVWQLESFSTSKYRRLYFRKSHKALPILLAGSDRDIGLLYVGFNFAVLKPSTIEYIYSIAQLFSMKLHLMLVEKDKAELEHDIESMIKSNKENIRQLIDISKQLYAITAISTRMNELTDYTGFFRKINTKLASLLSCDSVLVFKKSLNDKNYTLTHKYLGNIKLGTRRLKSISQIVSNLSFQDGRPIIMNNYYVQSLPEKSHGIAFLPYKTILCAPLISRSRLHGVLVLLHIQEMSYQPDTIRLLSGITNMLAMAMENIDLYNEARRKQNKVSFLLSSISRFGETLDLAETLKSVVKEAARLVSKRAAVYLLSRGKVPLVMLIRSNEDGEQLDTYETLEPETLRYLLRYFESTRRSIIVNNLSKTRSLPRVICKTLRRLGIKSLLGVPIRLRENPLGALLLCNLDKAKLYSQEDLEVVKGIADAAAIAIKNSHVFSAAQELSCFLEKKIIEGARLLEPNDIKDYLAIEDTQEMVFRIDLRGNLVFMNKAMENKTGYSKEMFYQGAIKPLDLLNTEDQEKLKRIINKILEGAIDRVSGIELNIRNRQGDRVVLNMNIYADKDVHGRIIGLEGIAIDITSKKLLEEEIKRSKELALLGEFSGAMAHQIRTPLSQIYVGLRRLEEMIGNNMLLGIFPPTPEKITISKLQCQELIKGILNNAVQLNQLVSDVLNYTKSFKFCFTKQQLQLLLQEALDDYREQFLSQNVGVEFHVDPDVPDLEVDAVFLGQAFRNIIQNSLEAMASGGFLRIQGEIYSSDQNYVKITFYDSGCGIAPEALEKVFYPFFTTKSQGTGLGLALACKIIEAHKGSIWAESYSGQGSKINILLPVEMRIGGMSKLDDVKQGGIDG